MLPSPHHQPAPARFLGNLLGAVCLALAVSSMVVAAPPIDRSGQLQQKVDDLAFQLSLVRRFDRFAADARWRQLEQTLQAWNASGRDEADFQRMDAWLSAATKASLPGSRIAIPALPRFSDPVVLASAPEPPEMESPVVAQPSPPRPEPIAVAPRGVTEPEPPPAIESSLAVSPPAAPRRSVAVQAIDPGDPFRDDPADTRMKSRVALRPAALASPIPPTESVRINLVELRARIRGYEQGLRGVEAKLIATPRMRAEALLDVARELQQLAEQRQFVSLYVDTLTSLETAQAPRLGAIDEAKRLATSRLESLQQLADEQSALDEVFRDNDTRLVGEIERVLSAL